MPSQHEVKEWARLAKSVNHTKPWYTGVAAYRGRTTQRLPPQPLPPVPLLLLEIEERGTANARWRLRQLLHLMYMRRRKCWVRERVNKIVTLSKGGPSVGGDKCRANLFGSAYSSDNAGDGPRVRNGVSPTLSDRDRGGMMSHLRAARITTAMQLSVNG